MKKHNYEFSPIVRGRLELFSSTSALEIIHLQYEDDEKQMTTESPSMFLQKRLSCPGVCPSNFFFFGQMANQATDMHANVN